MLDIINTYQTAQYLLVMEPHQALCDEISKVKKHFAETYDAASSTVGKPNITLVRFEQFEMVEQRIIRRLQQVAAEHHSFMIELDGFGSYPTHSIFINVKTQTQITDLSKSLRPVQQLMKIDKERKPHFIHEPHINIARKLLPWQFEKGWLEISNTHFTGRFIVSHLLLLRKREGEARYETVKRFELMNEKVSTVQGALFS